MVILILDINKKLKKNYNFTPASLPDVAIIILNWNGWEDTIRCLESVYQLNYQNYAVILVDNGSKDDSISKIKDYCKGKIKFNSDFFEYNTINKPIKIIELTKNEIKNKKNKLDDTEFNNNLVIIKNEKNYGFAQGNNIAIRFILKYLDTDYIMLLNNDTIIDKNCFNIIFNKYKKDSNIGMFQPKMLKMYNTSIIDSTGHIFHLGKLIDRGTGIIDKGQFDNKTDIIGICAGAGIYKVDMLRDIGVFNKDYWAYYEDAELSWRAYKNGWKAKFIPEAIVFHNRGASKNKNENFALKLTKLNLNNQVKTVKKYGNKYNKILFCLWLIFESFISIFRKFYRKNNIEFKTYFNKLIFFLFK